MSAVDPGEFVFTPPTGPGSADAPAPRRSGWLVGLVLGVLASLLIMPTVRTTLLSQLQFAIAGESITLVRALDSRLNARETRLLDAAAASAPDDYLLQVGRATTLAGVGGAKDAPPPSIPAGDDAPDVNDHSLFRLAEVARNFPRSPGAYAHLARYMMLDRLRIQRAELTAPSPPRPQSPTTGSLPAPPSAGQNRTSAPESSHAPPLRSIPARHSDVRLMEWALRSGEARDADNAFWPALLATTYFAAERDDEGLEALARAARKPHWDAYLYEEVLGQWRLYSAAYGDNSATQKIGPLSLVAFPHLRELRRMAELARRRAESEAASGRETEAIRIRLNLAWLGVLMREKAQWAYEALIGTDLCLIASTDSRARTMSSKMLTVREWESEAKGYLELLKRRHRNFDIGWLHQEIGTSCELRERIDLARYDASYPGIPPGIPLTPLFSSWMAGICLLQQMLALAAVTLLAALWQNRIAWGTQFAALTRSVGLLALFALLAGSGYLLFVSVPSSRLALTFLGSLTLALALGLDRLGRRNGRKATGRKGVPESREAHAAEVSRVEARWKPGTTLRMLVFLVAPGLLALYALRAYLSSLHPVAILLTSLMDIHRDMTVGEALSQALLSAALPIGAALTLAGWAMYRRVPLLPGISVGLRRLTLPLLAALVFAYLLLLNGTLRLDIAASRAINEAAQNDLQWVLTHSESDTSTNEPQAPTP